MVTFNDLPRPVREQIYTLHLVQGEPVTIEKHRRLVNYKHNYHDNVRSENFSPALLKVSKKIEREAARFYYGENQFDIASVAHAGCLVIGTYPRHLKLVRNVICTWSRYGGATEGFRYLSRLKGLEELTIRVDEKEMVREMCFARDGQLRWSHCSDPTPQQQLTLLRYPGMNGLLSLSGIPHVRFVERLDYNGEKQGGSISGGLLETQVRSKITSQKQRTKSGNISNEDGFRFLSLPPEVRNLVYDLLLRIPGAVSPSTLLPSSVPKYVKQQDRTRPDSALSVLAVNKQIHEEAIGIFYHFNAFQFFYPTRLHAFVISLGDQRQSFLRDVTLHYDNARNGGIDLAELSMPVLQQLPGLRRLRVLLKYELSRRIDRTSRFSHNFHIGKANPAMVPGIRSMFKLRNIDDIKLRDHELEDAMEALKKKPEYPQFADDSKDGCVVKLAAALEHFNIALQEAQKGRVNGELLKDNQWQTRDVFPVLEDLGRERSPEL
ncbi:hypothetical protein LTR08_004122 [Meristemomyces frigidus]|nr:hypothetical protein LTR08_004122 [Meristemomyces frigidus]